MTNSTKTGTETPKNSFVVRNPAVDNRYLGGPGHFCSRPAFKDAYRFPTIEEAKKALPFDSSREIYEVTYGLRWYRRGQATSEYSDSTGTNWNTKKGSARFASAELARAIIFDPYIMYGARGPSDETGFKVVRFLKKVKVTQ